MYEYKVGLKAKAKFPVVWTYQGKAKAAGIEEMANEEIESRKALLRKQAQQLKSEDAQGIGKVNKAIEEEQQNPKKVPPKMTSKVSPKDKPDIPISQALEEDDNSKGISQNDFIPGGSFNIARQIFSSEIWLKPPLYLKVWIWIIGQANHADRTKNNRTYRRGELITIYEDIIKGIAYYFNRSHIMPTLKQVRIILQWLESEGMIILEPLRANDPTERLTRADPRADLKTRTRAYLGIRISVINYNTYQDLKSYKGRPQKGNQGIPSVQLGHNNKNGQVKNNIYGQNFLSFWKDYPNKAAKKKAFEMWQKLEDKKILPELPTLLGAIEKQEQAKERGRANNEFVPEWPHGATWLNGRRWEDEVDSEKEQDKSWDI